MHKMHKHVFMLLGWLQSTAEETGRLLYWCRECGTPALKLRRKFAIMTAEWSLARIEEEGIDGARIVHEARWETPHNHRPKPKKKKKKSRKALGRGLSEIKRTQDKVSLDDLRRVFEKPGG